LWWSAWIDWFGVESKISILLSDGALDVAIPYVPVIVTEFDVMATFLFTHL
jgi:hypothetical protein